MFCWFFYRGDFENVKNNLEMGCLWLCRRGENEFFFGRIIVFMVTVVMWLWWWLWWCGCGGGCGGVAVVVGLW